MPRGTSIYNTSVSNVEVSPILLVRFIDMQHKTDGTYESLYITDYVDKNINTLRFYDENGEACDYICMNVTYDQIEVSSDSMLSEANITIDNVTREFSSLAQYYNLQGTMVHVLSATRETLSSPDGAVMKFAGRIHDIHISEYNIQLSIRPGYSLYDLAPKLMYDSIRFPYIPASKDIREVIRK